MSNKKHEIVDLKSLLQLPAKKRLDQIINSPEPIKLVRSLSPQDLLLTIKEVGAEDCLEIIELFSSEQVQSILDLEIWEGDRLDPKKVGQYFSLLFEANPDRAVRQIYDLDIELLGLMVKMVSTIYDTTQNEEPEDYSDITSTSPGGRFIICFDTSPENIHLSRALCALLDQLYFRDMKMALLLLERIRFEVASGLEEASFHFRNVRLSELGIWPPEERLAFFAPLSPKKSLKKSVVTPEASFSLPVRVLGADDDSQHPFIAAALNNADDEQKNRFDLSFQHAAVNMHASLSGDFGDREELKKTGQYVQTLIEYGLLQVCNADKSQAQAELFSRPLIDFIRIGRTPLLKLRGLVQGLCSNPLFLVGDKYAMVDAPLREVAIAICQKEPEYYEGLLDPRQLTIRYFANLTELHATTKAITELQFRAALVGPIGLNYEPPAELATDKLIASHAGILTQYLICTFNQVPAFTPLTREAIASVLEKGRLRKDFVAWCRKEPTELLQRLAKALGKDEEGIKTGFYNFVTTILATLETNPYFLL
jgi:hypothetical protein